jgi:hypothetical protein
MAKTLIIMDTIKQDGTRGNTLFITAKPLFIGSIPIAASKSIANISNSLAKLSDEDSWAVSLEI